MSAELDSPTPEIPLPSSGFEKIKDDILRTLKDPQDTSQSPEIFRAFLDRYAWHISQGEEEWMAAGAAHQALETSEVPTADSPFLSYLITTTLIEKPGLEEITELRSWIDDVLAQDFSK